MTFLYISRSYNRTWNDKVLENHFGLISAWHFSTFIVFLRTWNKQGIDNHFDSVLQPTCLGFFQNMHEPLRTMIIQIKYGKLDIPAPISRCIRLFTFHTNSLSLHLVPFGCCNLVFGIIFLAQLIQSYNFFSSSPNVGERSMMSIMMRRFRLQKKRLR